MSASELLATVAAAFVTVIDQNLQGLAFFLRILEFSVTSDHFVEGWAPRYFCDLVRDSAQTCALESIKNKSQIRTFRARFGHLEPDLDIALVRSGNLPLIGYCFGGVFSRPQRRLACCTGACTGHRHESIGRGYPVAG